LVRAGLRGPIPVAEHWVTLHRIGSDSAAPLDSMHTRRDGGYAFTYRRWGNADAIYIVSATYEGVAYFTAALTGARSTGPDAEIMVFDTTSEPVALHVRGRHLVVSRPGPAAARTVVEVYELSNDSSVTLVPRAARGDEAPRPTWEAALPAGARDFQGGQGDIGADAMRAAGGRAQVLAPFAPGLKQLSYSYSLPPSAFPLRVALDAPASVLEVLLEEPDARAVSPGLAETDSATASGHTFRRFLAHDVPAGTGLVVTVPAAAAAPAQARTMGLYIGIVCGVLGLALLGALAFALSRRIDPAGAG
jgi:hypothetical protein